MVSRLRCLDEPTNQRLNPIDEPARHPAEFQAVPFWTSAARAVMRGTSWGPGHSGMAAQHSTAQQYGQLPS